MPLSSLVDLIQLHNISLTFLPLQLSYRCSVPSPPSVSNAAWEPLYLQRPHFTLSSQHPAGGHQLHPLHPYRTFWQLHQWMTSLGAHFQCKLMLLSPFPWQKQESPIFVKEYPRLRHISYLCCSPRLAHSFYCSWLLSKTHIHYSTGLPACLLGISPAYADDISNLVYTVGPLHLRILHLWTQ